MLSRIGQIAVTVRDLPEAVTFYRDVVGLNLMFQAPPQLAFFDCAGVRLMLSGEQPAAASSIVYYAVDDIAAVAGVLEGRGVRFEVTGPFERVAQRPHR